VTLGAYALFTALCLLLAYRGLLRTWSLAISVVIDIAVLMITIWSFHLEYNQPPTLYLKAPTLLYVFIIIALKGAVTTFLRLPSPDLTVLKPRLGGECLDRRSCLPAWPKRLVTRSKKSFAAKRSAETWKSSVCYRLS
jgi:hypothetical protein